ncbi:peptidylprolyl isomerase [Patescibacteria group bacterium]
MNNKNLLTLLGIPALILILVIFSVDKNFDTTRNPEEVLNTSQTTEKTNVPPPTERVDPTKSYTAVIKTTKGNMTIELYSLETQVAVTNFVYLSRLGFYNGTIFHRIVNNFMIQGGDPLGNGTGGPGYNFSDEEITKDYERGIVAMANSGPNTNGSQFFIVHKDQPDLPKNYVIFGKVIDGLDVLDAIAESEVTQSPGGETSLPIEPVIINSVEILET